MAWAFEIGNLGSISARPAKVPQGKDGLRNLVGTGTEERLEPVGNSEGVAGRK
jgi:hypothetical protein